MNQLLRLLILTFLAIFLYQYRYRVINTLFGFKMLRSFMVRNAFRIPGLREKFISQMF
jgi:hypothetical protein